RNTSKRPLEHKVYPYLLRGRTIDQPNQVWAADITYIPMQQGFLYLVAIIDWATRRVLSWRLSHEINCALRPNQIEAFGQKGHCKHRPSNGGNPFLDPGFLRTCRQFLEEWLMGIQCSNRAASQSRKFKGLHA